MSGTSSVGHDEVEPGAARPGSPRRPPRDRLGRSYAKLFGASTISNLGDGIATIAYPWLASAVTRDAVLIALVFVVQRLPWLLFSLPAGVITDRHDRRTLMVTANVARTILTLFVAAVVLSRQDGLPGPDDVAGGLDIATDTGLYLMVLVATLLLGIAEVLYDNAAQTFMPAIVDADHLERANGRLWSSEQVANTFAGPPLGALLIAIAFALPFFVDAATFAVSAALIALIPATARRDGPTTSGRAAVVRRRGAWRRELADGFRWLWHHELLRTMAIVLGLLNGLGMLSMAALVLFAQEVLGTSATEFALLSTGGAIGGIVGGWFASSISARIGTGPSLALTMVGGGTATFLVGLMTWWPAVWLLFAAFMLLAVLWNVITVSLRQTIIPDRLLGRVNSVYRFFGWGMMPVGTALGGLVIWATEMHTTREMALRMPWFVAGVLQIGLVAYAGPRLTSSKIAAARAAPRSS